MKSFGPILLTISFVFALYLHNIGELTIGTLFLPLASSIVCSFIFTFFLKRIIKSTLRANVFSSICIVLFFLYGEIVSLTGVFTSVSINIRSWSVFSLWCLLIVTLFVFIKKSQRSLKGFYQFIFIVSIISTGIPGIQIASYGINQYMHSMAKSPMELPAGNKTLLKNTLPDIYYIVPEDYSSPLVLKKYFNYDSSKFIGSLEQKGFYVASHSTSNYPKTFLSLPSSLNMEYLDYLSLYKNSTDQTIVTPLIEHSNVLRFLKSYGYTYYQMGSWWGPASYNRYAKENFILENEHLIDIDEFTYTILDSTMLSPIIRNFFAKVTVGDSEEDKRARILYQFRKLPEVVKLPGPKFIFAHIIAPHGPYVFGTSCEFKSVEEAVGNEVSKNYTQQAACINKKLIEAVDAILAASKNPPVIIIQSDEGAPFLNEKLTPFDNWKEAKKELLQEKFPIFAAYYFPLKQYDSLYPTITPVNTFRLVFNQFFGSSLPLLPDKNYIFSDMEHLYEFKEVTGIVQK